MHFRKRAPRTDGWTPSAPRRRLQLGHDTVDAMLRPIVAGLKRRKRSRGAVLITKQDLRGQSASYSTQAVNNETCDKSYVFALSCDWNLHPCKAGERSSRSLKILVSGGSTRDLARPRPCTSNRRQRSEPKQSNMSSYMCERHAYNAICLISHLSWMARR